MFFCIEMSIFPMYGNLWGTLYNQSVKCFLYVSKHFLSCILRTNEPPGLVFGSFNYTIPSMLNLCLNNYYFTISQNVFAH